MKPCVICGCTEFNIEAGYYFCQECQTQCLEVREEVLDLNIDVNTRLRKVKIRRDKFKGLGEEVRWTSWEQYNFILIGLTNELIELGATTDVKLTILQLWATYLGKIEVAFISTKKHYIPKLARRFHKKDAEIIYGKCEEQKRNKKRKRSVSSNGTSISSSKQSEAGSTRELNRQKRLMVAAEYDRYVQSQDSSYGDATSSVNQSSYNAVSSISGSSICSDKTRFSRHAYKEAKKVKSLSKKLPFKKKTKYKLKHVTTKYKQGPYIITPMRLWAIVYLALRIHDEDIHLGDMLRYGKEGHLSYYKIDHLLPPEVIVTKNDINILTPNQEVTHIGMRQISANIAKFLNIREIDCPDFLPLISRYCHELQLPRGILLYTERLIALSPPKMWFNEKDPLIPNYEGRAIAFIIVVLKLLFGMDGITEYEISRVAEKINSKASTKGILDSRLFSFREWQQYIECRKIIIANAHFTSKLKHKLDLTETSHLYLHYLRNMQSKNESEEPEMTNNYKLIPWEVANAMRHCISKLNEDFIPLKEVEVFAPSLTPQYSYLEQLLKHPLCDVPSILGINFVGTKVGFMTKPEHLQKLAAQCGIKLDIVDSNLHFIEKIVPPFEVSKMLTKIELNKHVHVKDQDDQKTESTITLENEDLTEYLYRENTSRFRLDVTKQLYYDTIQSSIKNNSNSISKCFDDVAFNDVLLSGSLFIPNGYDSVSEVDHTVHKDDKANLICEVNSNNSNNMLQIEFCEKYNLIFSNQEKKAILYPEEFVNKIHNSKPHVKPLQDSKGKFIKKSAKRCLEPIDSDFYSEKGPKKQSNNNKNIRGTENSTLQNNTYVFTSKNKVSANKPLKSKSNLKKEWKKDKYLKNCSNSDTINSIVSSNKNTSLHRLDNLLNLNDDEILVSQDSSYDSDENVFATSNNDKYHEGTFDDFDQLFRPYKDYWTYHCIFSTVKPKSFEHFEKELPISFRWLLNECANVIEMTMEDLYKEVCLIEKYHMQFLNPSNLEQDNEHNDENFISKKCFIAKNKW